MEKKTYEPLEIEVVAFDAGDIITDSHPYNELPEVEETQEP